jgi:glycosyltransferase involved in cell wall biosynthesis
LSAPRARRIKVVSLVDGLGITGGGERFARQVTLAFDPERVDATLCVSRWTPAIASDDSNRAAVAELEARGVRFIGLDRSSTLDLRAWKPLLAVMRDEDIDVLHSHKFGSNVWGAVLSHFAPRPVFVAHEQTWSYQGMPLRRFLDRELIARRARAFIAVSSEDARRMASVERIDPATIVMMPNAIPTPPPVQHVVDLRRELQLDAATPLIGAVCVLRAQKALDVLIDAFAVVLQSVPRAHLVIAGDGEERSSIERHITRLGLEDRVSLLGVRGDVPALLPNFDVAALSSDYEGTPLAVMEYMEAALPIVSTRVGGVPDLIDHDKQGLLVEPRDPAALGAAITRLLQDREFANRLGEQARSRRRAEFDIKVAASRLEELYRGLVGVRGNDLGPG